MSTPRLLVLFALFVTWLSAVLWVVDGRVDGWDILPLAPAALLGFLLGRWVTP